MIGVYSKYWSLTFNCPHLIVPYLFDLIFYYKKKYWEALRDFDVLSFCWASEKLCIIMVFSAAESVRALEEARPYPPKMPYSKRGCWSSHCVGFCHEPAVIRLVSCLVPCFIGLRCICFGGNTQMKTTFMRKVHLVLYKYSCCKVTALTLSHYSVHNKIKP